MKRELATALLEATADGMPAAGGDELVEALHVLVRLCKGTTASASRPSVFIGEMTGRAQLVGGAALRVLRCMEISEDATRELLARTHSAWSAAE